MGQREGVLVAVIAVVLIVVLTGLYLLKKRRGWSGWRRAPQWVLARTLGFVVWVVVKKVPWKPILVWGPWVVMILGLGFYGVENWRGKRAWKEYEAEVKGRGGSLVFAEYVPGVPAEENVLEHPEVVRLMGARRSLKSLDKIKGISRRAAWGSSGPKDGIGFDVRQWLDPVEPNFIEVEAAERVLELAASSWAELDALAGALGRPTCRITYGPRDPFDIRLPDGLGHLMQWAASNYRARAIVYAKLGRSEECARDLASLRRVPTALLPADTIMAYVIQIGATAAHGPALWEALSAGILDEDQLARVDRELGQIEMLPGMARALQMERCMVLDGIEYAKDNRKKGVELVTGLGGLPAPTGGSFEFVWEWMENKWYHGELRFGPGGWFDRGKVTAGRGFTEWIELAGSGDVERIREILALPEPDPFASPDDEPQGIDALVQLVPGVTELVAEKALQTQTNIAMQRVAVALERYRLKHERYPPEDGELVPEFLPVWPEDLLGGQPLILEFRDDGTPWIVAPGLDGERGTRDDQGWQYSR